MKNIFDKIEHVENERETLGQRIDKFVFNINNINKIIAILMSMFIVFGIIFYCKRNSELDFQNDVYENMLREIEAHQLNVIYTNITPNSGQVDPSKNKELPKYKNAKEAVNVAFQKYYNSTSYEIEGNGRTIAEAVGQEVEIVMSFTNVKYSDGVVFNEFVRKETQTNFGQTDAAQTIYKDGRKYKRNGTNIRKSNGRWIADFSGNFHDVTRSTTSHPWYIVNENTITASKFFSFARDDYGNIAYYKATVLLDPKEATKEYAKNIQEEGGTSLPSFGYVEMSCIIDRDGNLLSYTVQEEMTLTKHIVTDITTTTKNTITGVVLSMNQTPSRPEIQP